MKLRTSNSNQPNWKDFSVKLDVPQGLDKLVEIANNLWWVWNHEAEMLFRDVNPEAWKSTQKNPLLMFEKTNYERFEELEKDANFMNRLNKVYNEFSEYVKAKPRTDIPSVSYFSMEYGLSSVLKIYSGGLGVLAGDYLKEASDCNVNMTAVGFLYQFGYFKQTLSIDGQQIAVYEPQQFNTLPIEQIKDENGAPLLIAVPYPERLIYAQVWKVAVGRISLYLLDTNINENSEADRTLTHQLYGGDNEHRLKQEMLLGIGGMLMLKRLGIKTQIYHCNEGHAALINVQRLVDYVAEGLSFNEAIEVVRASSLYTVHTPVPAGHDRFDEGLFRYYMGGYADKLRLSWEEFIGMGRENPDDHSEKFCMSVFACNTSQEVNGVSWLHGKVSQEMFNPIWKGYFPEELHVSYVTNGVHMPTWAASEWKAVYEKTFGKEFYADQSNLDIWKKIYDVPDKTIWETRMTLKNKLIDYIRTQFKETWLASQRDPGRIVSVLENINPNALLVGFGRRFATYKRAHLLFTDLERLAKIVNNPERPVQFIFTGKAHPADGAGQGLIKRIFEISHMPQFVGKIIFLENYDMHLAKRLISGVDIWLNNPTRPLEASGTSGQKAEMNGVLNFSVLDGWWLEGYVKGAGWALTEKRTFDDQGQQDRLDAATIYNILENEILPLYFAKNKEGFSPDWIQVIKNSIAKIAPRFTTKRMLDDYIERFYAPEAKRSALLLENNYAKAKEIAAWKQMVAANWDNITIERVDIDAENEMLELGHPYHISAEVDTKGMDVNSLGIEIVVTYMDDKNRMRKFESKEFDVVKVEGSRVFFELDYQINRAGSFKYAFRMFPKNADLPHRMDFCYVRWF
ncbi:MAG: alpha-glucan family phosphorylase [Paludibacteraceae bacterium]|nr:alpha-glucan family phosphorylase [Paludibacteraceae bacterium]